MCQRVFIVTQYRNRGEFLGIHGVFNAMETAEKYIKMSPYVPESFEIEERTVDVDLASWIDDDDMEDSLDSLICSQGCQCHTNNC